MFNKLRFFLEGNKPQLVVYMVMAGITFGLAAISIATGHNVAASRGH